MKSERPRRLKGRKQSGNTGSSANYLPIPCLNETHHREILLCIIARIIILVCMFCLAALAVLIIHNHQLIRSLEKLF